MSNHDHGQVEIFCYADVVRPDAVTATAARLCRRVAQHVGLSDQQAAELIRSDQIDILVDLTMHMANNRLLIFARKPAPVQVAWLAYPGTTGLAAMDYRLTDPYLDPPGEYDACYSEQSIRLPDTFWCYDPLADQPLANDLPALANGFITFGCLNNFCKVNDGVLAALGESASCRAPVASAAAGAPRASTGPCAGGSEASRGLLSRAWSLPTGNHGSSICSCITGSIWVWIPCRLQRAHHQSRRLLDGRSTVTLIGKTVVGRAGWSQLCNLGLQELAARDAGGVRRDCRESGRRPAQAAGLCAEPRGRGCVHSPLMDAPSSPAIWNGHYRQMWHNWCQKNNGPI